MKINNVSVMTGLVLGGLMAFSSMAVAQDQKPGGGKGRGPSIEQRMERLTEELKLTDAQKPKVKAVLEATAKKAQDLRGDSSVPREERREKMQAIMQDESKQMKGILTPDQYTQYEKMRSEMRGGGKKREGEKKEGESK